MALRRQKIPCALTSLVTLLALLAAGSVEAVRVVVLEQGFGETRRASVLDTRHETGTQTMLSIQTWQASQERAHGSLLLQPVAWVYQQLEAMQAEAMQRASLDAILQSYQHTQHEAYGGSEAGTSAASFDMEQEEMSDKLHRLGCQRFSVAMDEYLQMAEAAAIDDAVWDLQDAVEAVESSADFLHAQLDMATQLVEVEAAEAEAEEEQVLERTMLVHELHRFEDEPTARESEAEDAVLAELLSAGLLDDGSRLMSVSANPDDWDSMPELQSRWASHHTLLRGQSDWWSAEAADGHRQDVDHDGVFLPHMDLEEQYRMQQHRKQGVTAAGTAPLAAIRAEDASAATSDMDSEAFTVDSFGSDNDVLPLMVPMPNFSHDWPLLAAVSLVMVAMAATFLVSWVQLRSAGHGRHISLPITVSRNGRLVQGYMILPEAADGTAKDFLLAGGELVACYDGSKQEFQQQAKKLPEP